MVSKSERNTESHRGVLPLINALAVGALISLTLQLFERGADYGAYQAWTGAGAIADIHALGASLPVSVQGVPFSHWAPTSGLVAVPAWHLAAYFNLTDRALLWTGALCISCFWLSLWQALRLVSSPAWATFGCLLAAVATPLGYYSLSISSEAVYLLPVGVLAQQFASGLRGKRMQTGPVAASTCLLLLLRPYLAVYAWPCIAVLLLARPSWRERLAASTVIGLSIGVAAWPITTTHFWMTGNYFRSPYYFGDELFHSVDKSCPYWSQVLFDTFHGLLPNHPFVGLGCIALCVVAIQNLRTRQPAQIGWLVSVAAVSVHIYIQGCWYYWWMAEVSFGMRGLVPMAVPVVMAFVHLGRRMQVAAQSQGLVFKGVYQVSVAAALLMSLWSWLLWQQGPMDYVDWSALIDGQYLRLRTWTDPELLAIVAASGAAVCFALMQVHASILGSLRHLSTGTGVSFPVFGGISSQHQATRADAATTRAQGSFRFVGAGILGTLLLAHLLERAQMTNLDLTTFYATTLVVAAIAYAMKTSQVRFAALIGQTPRVICGILCATALSSYANLEWHTRPLLATRTDNFVTMNVPDFIKALETLCALKDVSRFDTQRIKVENFWLRQNERGVISDRFAPKPEEVRLRQHGTLSRQFFKPLG